MKKMTSELTDLYKKMTYYSISHRRPQGGGASVGALGNQKHNDPCGEPFSHNGDPT